MHPLITKPLDRIVIKLAAAMMPKGGKFPPRCEEAGKFLESPDFFSDNSVVPNVNWSSKTDFHFTSVAESPWPETKTVYGKFFRCGEDWASKPTIILIHGWNDDLGYMFRHPYLAKKFLKRGINTAMIELPYHLRRRPRGSHVVCDFISEDLLCNMQAVHQAIADIRSLISWLLAQGCECVGLWGVSLGGWLSGLVSCHDERVRFAVLQIPANRMDETVKELEFCEPIRKSMQGASMNFEKLNLRANRPKVTLENILIIEAVDDLFIAKEGVEEFWEAWGKPEIWRVRHGHISILMAGNLMKRGVNWVAEKVSRLKTAQSEVRFCKM